LFSFLEEVGKVFEDTLGGLDVRGVAVDGHILTAGVNSHVKQRLEILDVLVVNTKQRLQTTRRQLNLLQTLLTFSFPNMLPQRSTKCTRDSSKADFWSGLKWIILSASSAYLSVLCVKTATQTQSPQRYAENR
jgi:hypothetical protein